MAYEVALLLCAALIVTVVAALFSKSISITLIMLFYASIILGIIFTVNQAILVGLLHIITFAGAISVMLLTVVLMTGESDLSIGARPLGILVTAVTVLVVVATSYPMFSGLPSQELPRPPPDDPLALLVFLWSFRPWDLLILVVVFAASMIAVVNLLSREE